MKAQIVAGVLGVALAFSGPAGAQLVGVVIGVPDGDTLEVRIDEHVLNIHLKQIDAPEVGQPYGKRARQSLAELCEAKTVTLDQLGIGRHRRIVGEAECAGVDAGEEQVRRGLAWALEQRSKPSPLQALQARARAEHRGLWSEAAPVPPWEWSAKFTQ
jgi:endonuclease YncB( thermonuclease family)